MSFQCEFCSKYFVTKTSLNTHKMKTKYCLQIQKDKGLIFDVKGEEFCIHCDKSFHQKSSKLIHENNCKNKILSEKESLIQEIKDSLKTQSDLINTYENDIKTLKCEKEFYKSELAKKDDLIKLSIEKSGIITNNNNSTSSSSTKLINKQINVMNCLDLSDERLKKAADNYTFDHYNRAAAGMVDWCINNVIKDKDEMLYRCTDKNRRVFTFKTILGDTILDPNATQLKSSIKPILAEKLKGYKKINCKLMGEDSDDDNNEKVDAYLRLHAINKEMGIEFEKELVKKTYNII